MESSSEFKDIIRLSIENFSFLNASLFGLFILAFTLGNFFYGISLLREQRFTRLLGFLLLLWSMFTMLAFLNLFWKIEWLGNVLAFSSLIYQPIMRLLIAIWLFQRFKKLGRELVL